MGNKLIGEILAAPLPCSHAAARALLVMARKPPDSHDPPQYFGTWRPIAHHLNLTGTNAAKRASVSRLWAALARAGLIERVERIDDDSGRLAATWTIRRDRIRALAGLPSPVENPGAWDA